MTFNKISFIFNSLPPPPSVIRLKNRHIFGRSSSSDRSTLAICGARKKKILAYNCVREFSFIRSNANMKGICGRSMIEMLGVLAIIGILSAGGIMGYNEAMSRYHFNRFTDDIAKFAGQIRYIFPDFPKIKTSESIALTDIVKPTKELKEKKYGNIRISSIYVHHIPKGSSFIDMTSTYNANPSLTQFIISTFDNAQDCVKIVTYDWRNITKSFFIYVYLGNWGSDNSRYFFYDRPLSMQTAEQVCSRIKTTQNIVIYLAIHGHHPRYYIR